MRPLLKLAALTPGDRLLLWRAFRLVLTTRLVLAALPFRHARRLLSPERSAVSVDAAPIQRLSWAVHAAGRRVPGATCLVRALALNRLLAQAGEAGTLHIGVARDGSRGLDAHAWLEHGGRVVMGDTGDLARYATILTMAPTEAASR